jgi:hypothetical protein
MGDSTGYDNVFFILTKRERISLIELLKKKKSWVPHPG